MIGAVARLGNGHDTTGLKKLREQYIVYKSCQNSTPPQHQ